MLIIPHRGEVFPPKDHPITWNGVMQELARARVKQYIGDNVPESLQVIVVAAVNLIQLHFNSTTFHLLGVGSWQDSIFKPGDPPPRLWRKNERRVSADARPPESGTQMAGEQGIKAHGVEARRESCERYSNTGVHLKQLGNGNCFSACRSVIQPPCTLYNKTILFVTLSCTTCNVYVTVWPF
jgi:hypothetical protein